MATFSVVIDACVLYGNLLRDVLLRAAEKGLYRPVWSQHIVNEATAALVRDKRLSRAGAERLERLLREHFPEAWTSISPALIEAMVALPDPDDRHVLAAAVRENAEVIVTFNLDDFPAAATSQYGVEAQSPDDFLVNLFSLSPHDLVLIIDEMVEDYDKPSYTRSELLEVLAKALPTFSKLLQRLTDAERPEES
ncbi:MAG: PIN domain-containing protein [Candidatus Sericytochromatia bacterium]